MNLPLRAIVFDVDGSRGAELSSILTTLGLLTTQHDQSNLATEILKRERPNFAVIAEMGSPGTEAFPRLGKLAKDLKIPTLAVIGFPENVTELASSHDDWVFWESKAIELPLRVRRLLNRPPDVEVPAIDPRFLGLVVHDLRTPLNVIGLTIRAIGQSVVSPGPDFEEDLTFLHENARQIEKMLAQLGDYCRLVESEQQASLAEFQTRRFLVDFLEEKQMKRDSEFKSVRLEFAADSPEEVNLDPSRARLAIQHALANGVAAAGDAPVKLRSKGPAGFWTIEVVVEKAPPATITSTRLRPHLFERLVGSAAERRGLDLAIASRVSELFGGSATLTVEPGTRSVISLEWPERPAS